MQRKLILCLLVAACFVQPAAAGWSSYLRKLLGGSDEADVHERRRMQSATDNLLDVPQCRQAVCVTGVSGNKCANPECWACSTCKMVKRASPPEVKDDVPAFACRFDKSGSWNWVTGYCGQRTSRKVGAIMIAGTFFITFLYFAVAEADGGRSLRMPCFCCSFIVFMIAFPIAGAVGLWMSMIPCSFMWMAYCFFNMEDVLECGPLKGSNNWSSNYEDRGVTLEVGSSGNYSSGGAKTSTYKGVAHSYAKTWDPNPQTRFQGAEYGGQRWQCPACTYDNAAQSSVCYMCNTGKPDTMCVLAGTQQGTVLQPGQEPFTRYHDMTHNTVTSPESACYTSTTDCYSGGSGTTYLDLHYNDIATINLGRWPNLIKLNLESNQLPNLNGISTCLNLQWIDVGNNNLGPIDGINGLQQLIYFSAKSNGIKSVSLSNLPSLEYFDVSNNDIKSIRGLGQCSKLRHVYLDKNFLSSATGVMQVTTTVTGNCPRLQEVRLRKNDFESYENDQISNHYRSFSHVNLYIDNGSRIQVS